MKKINLILFGFVLLLVGTSCERDRNFVEFEDLETGAYARQLSRTGEYILTEPENAIIDVSVEFYDVNQGKDVASYAWNVQYIDKETDGAASVGPVDLFTIESSQFGTSEAGLPSADFSLTLNDALNALGLTTDDVAGGSTVRFNATLTMNDGRTFTSANTGNNIVSSAAFRALFTVNADLLCPTDLAGEINYVTTDALAGDGQGTPTTDCTMGGSYTGTMTIGETSEVGTYSISDASFGVFAECYALPPAEGVTLTDACLVATVGGSDQYSDTYAWTIVDISGPVMTIDWINTWGDAATTVLTRADGSDWPMLRQ